MIRLPLNKIAVEPVQDPDKIGSIWVPDAAKERCDQGIVKYIGPDVKWIEVGDYVLFSGYTGQTIALEDEGVFIVLPEDFVVAKIDPPNTTISGLYFKDEDGSYFTANYEQAFYLMAKAMQRLGLSEQIKIKNLIDSRPKVK